MECGKAGKAHSQTPSGTMKGNTKMFGVRGNDVKEITLNLQ